MTSRTVKMIQWCPQCRMLAEATLILGFEGGWHVSDKSTCDQCQKVLWDWKRGQNSADVLKSIPTKAKKAIQGKLFG